MRERTIVAATDDSAAGRRAVETAVWVAARMEARLSVVTVTPVAGIDRIHTVAHPAVGSGSIGTATAQDLVVLTGLPGIEIVRYAEAESAELIVLGRSRRSSASRWLIGDTGDAVARRSSIPCLFVPPGHNGLTRALVAVDGTERGLMVLRRAMEFARELRIPLGALTVESDFGGGPDRQTLVPPATQARRISGALEQFEARADTRPGTVPTSPPLITRYGEVVEEVLGELSSSGADLLAVGYHRGGPSGILEGHSVGRRLVHWAPTAVLTVPL